MHAAASPSLVVVVVVVVFTYYNRAYTPSPAIRAADEPTEEKVYIRIYHACPRTVFFSDLAFFEPAARAKNMVF